MYTVKNKTGLGGKSLLPESVYFKGFRPAVIDIETTGLSPGRDFIYLIGVLTEEEGEGVITQFLAENRSDEKALLQAFEAFISDYDLLLNYNGRAFDIPFINKRAKKHGTGLDLDTRLSLDYLRIFRESYIKEMLPDLKLKTVEKLAGVFRNDVFSGKECIDLYKKFSAKGDRTAGRQVLLHNYEDLSCFPDLNTLIDRIDFHKALAASGFPVRGGDAFFFVSDAKLRGETINASGTVSGLSEPVEIYEADYSLRAEAPDGYFSLSIDYLSVTGGSIHDGSTGEITASVINEAVLETLQNRVKL